MIYVFDTSALIALFRDGRYDKIVFPKRRNPMPLAFQLCIESILWIVRT